MINTTNVITTIPISKGIVNFFTRLFSKVNAIVSIIATTNTTLSTSSSAKLLIMIPSLYSSIIFFAFALMISIHIEKINRLLKQII